MKYSIAFDRDSMSRLVVAPVAPADVFGFIGVEQGEDGCGWDAVEYTPGADILATVEAATDLRFTHPHVEFMEQRTPAQVVGRVFLLVWDDDSESAVDGVFTTRERAEAALAELVEDLGDGDANDCFRIEEHEVVS